MCHTMSSYRSRVVTKIEWLISSGSEYVEYRRLPIVYILADLSWKEELQKELAGCKYWSEEVGEARVGSFCLIDSYTEHCYADVTSGMIASNSSIKIC
jgi:hypothetical protein